MLRVCIQTQMGLKQKSRKRQRALDDEVYEVEAIVDFRINEGKEQFFIKWKGYASVENTWESAGMLFQSTTHELY
ncbi:Chromobox protein 5 [Batrachochytrium dendrobatidis]|nr:Chromobox protein 5 [Batrachochytrium dendrobatidis]